MTVSLRWRFAYELEGVVTDVREKLGRLNPSTIRYDTGHGGTPDLTNIDIAHALGTVPKGLGRDLLELLYWPDGAVRRLEPIVAAIFKLAMDEYYGRKARYAEAQTTWGLAECLATYHRDRSGESKKNREILKARVAVARDNLWPERLSQLLPRIASLLVGYMKGDRLTKTQKAKALEMDESSYRKGWEPIFEWMLTQMIEAEAEAARQLEAALRNRV